MGGTGPGHKSWEARQARLVNIAKARAARRRAPLPWRSGMESRIIEQLVWQWWITTSGEGRRTLARWEVTAGPSRPKRAQSVAGGADRPWAKYRVARFLGVSHTWVNKLVKRFEADPERMPRRMAAFAPASLEKLEMAREETRRQRERGWLRGPIRTRRVKFVLEGRKRTIVLPTNAEKRRRQAEARGRAEGPLHVRYQELPMWARGLLLPSEAAKATGFGTGARVAGRARPFAFRRRRW